MAWVGVVTDVGNAALEASLADAEEINLNLVKIGTGYIPVSNMKAATDLDTPVGTGVLESKDSLATGVRICVSVFPSSEPMTITEVGVFGTFEGNSILFALYQNEDGIDIPSQSEFPDYSYNLNAILDIDDLDTLTITIDSSAVVSQESLAIAMSKKVDIDQGISNSGKFLVVNNQGKVVPTTVPFANGGSF